MLFYTAFAAEAYAIIETYEDSECTKLSSADGYVLNQCVDISCSSKSVTSYSYFVMNDDIYYHSPCSSNSNVKYLTGAAFCSYYSGSYVRTVTGSTSLVSYAKSLPPGTSTFTYNDGYAQCSSGVPVSLSWSSSLHCTDECWSIYSSNHNCPVSNFATCFDTAYSYATEATIAVVAISAVFFVVFVFTYWYFRSNIILQDVDDDFTQNLLADKPQAVNSIDPSSASSPIPAPASSAGLVTNSVPVEQKQTKPAGYNLIRLCSIVSFILQLIVIPALGFTYINAIDNAITLQDDDLGSPSCKVGMFVDISRTMTFVAELTIIMFGAMGILFVVCGIWGCCRNHHAKEQRIKNTIRFVKILELKVLGCVVLRQVIIGFIISYLFNKHEAYGDDDFQDDQMYCNLDYVYKCAVVYASFALIGMMLYIYTYLVTKFVVGLKWLAICPYLSALSMIYVVDLDDIAEVLDGLNMALDLTNQAMAISYS